MSDGSGADSEPVNQRLYAVLLRHKRSPPFGGWGATGAQRGYKAVQTSGAKDAGAEQQADFTVRHLPLFAETRGNAALFLHFYGCYAFSLAALTADIGGGLVGGRKYNLALQMNVFLNNLDLSHVSIW